MLDASLLSITMEKLVAYIATVWQILKTQLITVFALV